MRTDFGLEEIEALLEQRFIKYRDIARILTLAIRGNQNVILWGPGGHGKSEIWQNRFFDICSGFYGEPRTGKL